MEDDVSAHLGAVSEPGQAASNDEAPPPPPPPPPPVEPSASLGPAPTTLSHFTAARAAALGGTGSTLTSRGRGLRGRDRAAVSAGDSNTAVTAGGEADAPVDSGLPAAGAAVEDGRRLRRPWAARPAVAGSDDDRMAAIVRREHRIAGGLKRARLGQDDSGEGAEGGPGDHGTAAWAGPPAVDHSGERLARARRACASGAAPGTLSGEALMTEDDEIGPLDAAPRGGRQLMGPPPSKTAAAANAALAAAAAAAAAVVVAAVPVAAVPVPPPAAPPAPVAPAAPAVAATNSREDEAPEMPEDAEVAGGLRAAAARAGGPSGADAELGDAAAAALSEEDGEEGVSPEAEEAEAQGGGGGEAAAQRSLGAPADAMLTA